MASPVARRPRRRPRPPPRIRRPSPSPSAKARCTRASAPRSRAVTSSACTSRRWRSIFGSTTGTVAASTATTRSTSGSAARSASTRRPTRPAAPVTTTVVMPADRFAHPPAYHAFVSRLRSRRRPVPRRAVPRRPGPHAAGPGSAELGRGPPVRPDDRHRRDIGAEHRPRRALPVPGAGPHRRPPRAAGHRARHRRRRPGRRGRARDAAAHGRSAPSTPTGRCSSTWRARSARPRRPPPPAPTSSESEPGLAMFGGLMQMLSPMMLGMSVGSMVGHLSRRSFGQYDLPIPRPASPRSTS